MLKVIKLNRFVFDKGVIQHNVIVRSATLFGGRNKVIEERINCLTTLIENLAPASITIKSLEQGTRLLTENEKTAKCFKLANRHSSFNEGDELALDQFKDLAIYCYLECLQLELDILDIKNQHITACANIGTQSDYYLYGPPESINDEYIERCKKQLPGWKIAGSFKETL